MPTMDSDDDTGGPLPVIYTALEIQKRGLEIAGYIDQQIN
jgi:hypothetical protein